MVTLVSFFDEASDDRHIFIMAGWLATVDEWERFSDAWRTELEFEPRIEYFDHNEAMGLKGQFKGWKESDRDAKVRSMATVIAKYPSLVGIVGEVRVPEHSALFEGSILPKKSLRKIIKSTEPYHLACQCAIAHTLGHQVLKVGNCTDQVDFVFDNGVRYLNDCIANCPNLKKLLPREAQDIFGTVVSGNDRSIVALQAADILAGQQLVRFRMQSETTELLTLMGAQRIRRKNCPVKSLEGVPKSISLVNVAWATKRLEKAKRGAQNGGKAETSK